MLTVDSNNKRHSAARSRSQSASSNLLLSRNGMSNRQSVAMDSASGGAALSHVGSLAAPYTPSSTGGPATPYSYFPMTGNAAGTRTSGIVNIKAAKPVDPWFRQPRPKRTTVEIQSPSSQSHGSMSSGDWQKIVADDPDSAEGLDSRGSWVAPLPAHLGNQRERSGSNPEEAARPKTDYATREVDYYYGVRGPALSHAPTRRLKTGPADPTGPVSSATGWFKGFFGDKTKEKGKGFEVLRSSRMPPPRSRDEVDIPLQEQTPYQDHPEGVAVTPTKRRTLALEDEGDSVGAGTRRLPSKRISPVSSDDEGIIADGEISDEEDHAVRVTPEPPTLDIDTGDEFQVPTRFGSEVSSRPTRQDTIRTNDAVPAVPRKSSRRTGSCGSPSDFDRLSMIPQSPSGSLRPRSLMPDTATQRMPFVIGEVRSLHHRGDSSLRTGNSSASALSISSNNNSVSNVHRSPTPNTGRPSSLGYVQQHRAGDGVHVVVENHIPEGATAELVTDTPPRLSGSPSHTKF